MKKEKEKEMEKEKEKEMAGFISQLITPAAGIILQTETTGEY